MIRKQYKDEIALYVSLFENAKKQINNDPEYLQLNKIDKIDTVDKKIFDDYRLFKLKRTIQNAYNNSKFYKNLYDKNNVDIRDIKSIEDLKYLPLTTPADVAAAPYDFLCVSQAEIKRAITFTSSGTIGPVKRIFFTEDEVESMTDFMASGMCTVTNDNDTTQIFLPKGPVIGQADLLGRGVKKMKGSFVATGMLCTSEEQVQSIIDKKVTTLFGETRLIYRITKEMEKKYDLSKLGVRVIFVTTSYICDTVREYLEKAWNARVTSHYGLVEMGLGVAVECGRGCGYHYNELDVIAETVDFETGKVKPYGEEGEMCFTSIQRHAMPLIRYRSGDIGSMTKADEGCQYLDCISDIKAREKSKAFVGNIVLTPTYFDNELFKIDSLIDYDLYLESTEDNKTVLVFKVETVNQIDNIEEQLVKMVEKDEKIKAELQNGNIASIKVEYLGKDTLKSEIQFKKLIHDMR